MSLSTFTFTGVCVQFAHWFFRRTVTVFNALCTSKQTFSKTFFYKHYKVYFGPFQDKVFTYNVQGQLALSRKTRTVYSLLISP
jgi:hypothetical protein